MKHNTAIYDQHTSSNASGGSSIHPSSSCRTAALSINHMLSFYKVQCFFFFFFYSKVLFMKLDPGCCLFMKLTSSINNFGSQYTLILFA